MSTCWQLRKLARNGNIFRNKKIFSVTRKSFPNGKSFSLLFACVTHFSKTAPFSDQMISNTWSKKASWKRTLIKCPLSLKVDYISSTYKVKPNVTKKQIKTLYRHHCVNVLFPENNFYSQVNYSTRLMI